MEDLGTDVARVEADFGYAGVGIGRIDVDVTRLETDFGRSGAGFGCSGADVACLGMGVAGLETALAHANSDSARIQVHALVAVPAGTPAASRPRFTFTRGR